MESNQNPPRGGEGRRRPTVMVVNLNNNPQIAPPGTPRLLNTTRVMYTVNTNTMHLSQIDLSSYGQHFMDMIDRLYDDDEEAAEVFGDSNYVDWEITTNPIVVEVGSKFHRSHVHFNLTLKHCLPNYSIRKLNQRFKEYIDAFPTPDGMEPIKHAVFSRLNGWDDNYANKELRDIVNRNAPTDAEARRLSEPVTQEEHVKNIGGKTVHYKTYPGNANIFVENKRRYNL